MNRQTKRILQRQGQIGADGAPVAQSTRPAPSTTRPPGGRGQGGGTPGGGARRASQSLPERTGEYAREVRNELVKVAWPGRPEVINYAVVVFVTLVLLTGIIFGLDYGFAKGVLLLFHFKK